MTQSGGGRAPAALRTLFDVGAVGGLTDGQLLDRFASRPGEAGEWAFAALVGRHGPMVLRVCRGLLRDADDADDAFQATFLVLARSARSIRRRDSVASWLHGVARRVSWRALASASRRRAGEREAAARARLEVDRPDLDDAGAIHEEIARLPRPYREAVVLCGLSGLNEAQASARLGCPVGTVRSRFARARALLRTRLAARGLAPSAGLLASASLADAAPPVLVASTARAAAAIAAGRLATGIVPPSSLALAADFSRTLLMTTTARIASALLALVFLSTGAAALARQDHRGRTHSTVDDVRRELLDLERAWAEAIVRRDAAAADRILAYEMVGTDPTGRTWTKADYLKKLGADGWGLTSYELTDAKVLVFGDAAVVTGLVRANAARDGTSPTWQRITNTYIRRRGAWLCVAWQNTAAPDSTPSPEAFSAGAATKPFQFEIGVKH